MRISIRGLLLCAALLLLPAAAASAADFKVLTQENVWEGKRVEQKFTANKFYSTYYLYVNVIRALEVEKRLSSEEIGQVIGQMIAGLKQNGMVQLVVSGYPGDGDLRVTLRTMDDKKHHQPILLLVSNFDLSKKRVVTSGDMNNDYATYFFLVGDKLVKYQLVTEAAEKKRAAQKSTNDLADYYLLNAESSDDAKGRALLLEAIKKEKKDDERFMLNLTLSEYYLLENKVDEARKALDAAKAIADSVGDEQMKQKLLSIYPYADDVYKYMVGGQSM